MLTILSVLINISLVVTGLYFLVRFIGLEHDGMLPVQPWFLPIGVTMLWLAVHSHSRYEE